MVTDVREPHFVVYLESFFEFFNVKLRLFVCYEAHIIFIRSAHECKNSLSNIAAHFWQTVAAYCIIWIRTQGKAKLTTKNMKRLVRYLVVDIFDFFKHLREDDSTGPNVDSFVVVFFDQDYFWRSVYSSWNVACQHSRNSFTNALNRTYSCRNILFNLS